MKWGWRHVQCSTLLAGLLLCACTGTDSEPATSDTAPGQETVATPGQQPYLNAPRGADEPVGTVQETMNSGGYTYARVVTAEGEIWLASSTSKVAVGDTMSLSGADNMGRFKSKTLDRTFEEIYFIDKFRPAGMTTDSFSGTVTETMNVAGYTYAQVKVGEELSWMASDTEENVIWLAAPETELSIGDVVEWNQGAVMKDFHSNTLDRTFAEILFVGALTTASATH